MPDLNSIYSLFVTGQIHEPTESTGICWLGFKNITQSTKYIVQRYKTHRLTWYTYAQSPVNNVLDDKTHFAEEITFRSFRFWVCVCGGAHAQTPTQGFHMSTFLPFCMRGHASKIVDDANAIG